nr:hypothetical protein [Georgenia muralis]
MATTTFSADQRAPGAVRTFRPRVDAATAVTSTPVSSGGSKERTYTSKSTTSAPVMNPSGSGPV